MVDIHKISETGHSIIEPMRTEKPALSWDEILIKGAQLAKIPLNHDEPVNTKTIIGPKAKKPLVIDTPIYITHMSFGALSKEVKIALAKGSAAVRTAMCSGEGGILPESMENAYKYIFEYVPNRYSVTEDNLKRVTPLKSRLGKMFKGFRSMIFARQIRRYPATRRLNIFLVKEVTKGPDCQTVPDELSKIA